MRAQYLFRISSDDYPANTKHLLDQRHWSNKCYTNILCLLGIPIINPLTSKRKYGTAIQNEMGL